MFFFIITRLSTDFTETGATSKTAANDSTLTYLSLLFWTTQKAAEINRSTFYANFVDIYALADQVKAHLEDEVNQLYALEVEQKFNSNAYHITFFKSGLNAIIKRWLNGGCRETPEEMDEIIRSEYHSRCP